ncbi:MAG: hypothetical protein NTW28_18650 [Candidatus Solibacter sp.]|nr:hypothetical protein [Candidatus Solibacter sp.]
MDRLGSVATDLAGAFILTYEDTELRARSEGKRADLSLVVSGPEEPETKPPVLFESLVRQRAGRTEEYIVRISSAQLAKAGVSIPSTTTEIPPPKLKDPGMVIARLTDADERNVKLRGGLKTITAKRVARAQAITTQFDQKLRDPLLSSLSRVPVAVRKSPNYLGPDEENVEAKTIEVIKSRLDRPPVSTFVHLSPAQIERLKSIGFKTGDNVLELKVESAKIPLVDSELGVGGNGTANSLLRECPISLVCRESSPDEESAEDALGLSTPDTAGGNQGTSPPGDTSGGGVTAMTAGCQCRDKTPAILPTLPIRAAVCLGGDAVGTLQ